MPIHPEVYALFQFPLQINSACNLYMELFLKYVIMNVKLKEMVCVFGEHILLQTHKTLCFSCTHHISLLKATSQHPLYSYISQRLTSKGTAQLLECVCIA